MRYLEQFAAAIAFLDEFETQARPVDVASVREYLLSFQSAEMRKLNETTRDFVRKYAQQHVELSPLPLANRCHTVSRDFRESLLAIDIFGRGLYQPCITVGNVTVNGVSLFPTTHDDIRSMIAVGPSPGRSMPSHVWITFPDMTVADLTLLATLRRSGDYEGGSDVLIWHPSSPGEILFEPLLVDNLFPTRVDRIVSTIRC